MEDTLSSAHAYTLPRVENEKGRCEYSLVYSVHTSQQYQKHMQSDSYVVIHSDPDKPANQSEAIMASRIS